MSVNEFDEVTPAMMKEIRRKNGLSLRDMAEVLGFEGGRGHEKVRQFESGSREPTGPVKTLYALLWWDLQTGLLPDWLFPAEPEGDGDFS